MQLTNVRKIFTQNSTIGSLFIDGNPTDIVIMEPFDRGLTEDMTLQDIQNIKVFGKTAIPTGTYDLLLIE